MPLQGSCKAYVGRRVLVLPYYGYGWGREDTGAPPANALTSLGPLPFQLRLTDLIASGDEILGASGTIEEAGHEFDRQWCCFYLRVTSEHNFTTLPGQYMVWIATTKLPVDARPERARYQWVTPDKSSPCLCGYGTVAESLEWVRDVYEGVMSTRRMKSEEEGGQES